MRRKFRLQWEQGRRSLGSGGCGIFPDSHETLLKKILQSAVYEMRIYQGTKRIVIKCI